MTIYHNFIGIDIGNLEFVMNIHGSKKTYTYANNNEGFEKLCSDHNSDLQNSLVVLEVTGGYERELIIYLQQYNIAIHRANGRQIKHFIRSNNIIAKSDNIDARALAEYACERHMKLKLFEFNKYEVLRELNTRRTALVKMRVQETNRSKAPTKLLSKNSFERILKVLNEEIDNIQEKINLMIESDPILKQKAEILKTVPGIGEITANALLAHMPEIGDLNQKQAASLAGLAPHPNQSGNRDRYRKTRGGRQNIKTILFMGAASTSQTKSAMGDFYRKLIDSGKPPMVAITAVMRKMVVIANARIKEKALAS